MSPGSMNLITIKNKIIGLLIILSLMIISYIIQPNNLVAEDVVPVEKVDIEPTKEELIKKVYHYAKIHNNNPDDIIKTINCENRGWDRKLQSKIINSKGIREDSWGLSQIHLPSHPNVTKEQAQDADFAIEFMAKNLGRGVTWSCFKK